MKKKVSPALIGAFVLGAVTLLVIGVVIFGSGRLFRNSFEVLLSFEGSVNGLKEGAPVKFLGVEIGSVTRILLQLGPNTKVRSIPVIVEIDREKLTGRGVADKAVDDPKFVKAAIDQGLRAQLETESFVTGVLFVSLDFYPDTPAKFVQPPGSRYIEIPTVPTVFQRAQSTASRILAKLDEIDFQPFVKTTTDAVKSIQLLVENPDLQEAFKGANRLVNTPELRAAVASLDVTVKRLNGTIESIDKLAMDVSGSTKNVTEDARQTFVAARDALREITATTASLQNVVGDDSSEMYQLRIALKEISGAARSLRLMADSLERNPRALLFGRPENEVKQ
jgi:phospholipid/cholesterol/gamma-HCH transport system substrate-binding protein